MLQLEEAQHLALAMSEHLAVEQDGMTKSWSGIRQFGKCASRLFQVAREQLHATIIVMQLAADAVVLLLCPNLFGAHPLEPFARRLDWTRKHETNRLEQRDRRRLQFTAFAPHGRLADVAC